MDLEELMERRRVDLEAAIGAQPHKFTSELRIMYRGWGADVADYFLESLSAAVLNADEQMLVARKIATERLGHGIPKIRGVPGRQQQRLDKLAVAAIEEGFVGSEEAPIEGLASVRRSNGTCSFPAFRFHECPHEI
jgi:hypothetical protein